MSDMPTPVTTPDLTPEQRETTNAERYGLPVPDGLPHDEAEMWVEGYEVGLADGDRQGAARGWAEGYHRGLRDELHGWHTPNPYSAAPPQVATPTEGTDS